MCLRRACWISQNRNRINPLSHRIAEGVFNFALAITANIIGIFTCINFQYICTVARPSKIIPE